MNYYEKIIIPKNEFKRINYYLTHEPVDEYDEYLHEDETIIYTANFPDGSFMDIKCCGVQFEPDSVNTAWTEAVLFKNNCEVSVSEVCENYEGQWELEDNEGNLYVVDVEVEK